MNVTIEIHNSTDSGLKESYNNDYGILADIEYELTYRDLRYEIYAGFGMGKCSFTILADIEDVTASEGDVVKIKDDSSVVQYVGMITNMPTDHSDTAIHSDRVFVQCHGEIMRAEKIKYTLLNDSDEGSEKSVSTTIDNVFQDIWEGGQHGSNYTPNKMPLSDSDYTNLSYSSGNNTLSSTAINVQYDEVDAFQTMLEMVHTENGTKDLDSVEPVIMYVDRTNTVYTKQRSTDILATFDIGTYSTESNFLLDSEDLEDDGLVELDRDRDGIYNKFIVNKTPIDSTQYAAEEETSQGKYGTRPLYINDSNIGLAETSTFWDGINKGLFQTLTGYRLILRQSKYGYDPWHPTKPDGYIRLTKDGGSAFGDFPFIKVTVIINTSGYYEIVDIGNSRPDINTIRLKVEEKDKSETVPDTTPPSVSFFNQRPTAYEKTYEKAQASFYLASYAHDESGISTVDFYISELTRPSTWGGYSLIGSGGLQAAPDADSQEYYEYTLNSGYYDLIGSGGLARGDIFKIKTIARDGAGNVAETTREFQLSEDPPEINVSFHTPDGEDYDFPVLLEAESSTGFRLKINTQDQSAKTVTCVYSGSNITVNKVDDGNEHYYLTDNMTKPDKGKVKVAVITVTNESDIETISKTYIKGVDRQALAPPVTVKEPSDVVDEETTTAPQFKDKIEFTAHFKEDDHIVYDTDVTFKIYSKPSGGLPPPWSTGEPVLEKTWTYATTPAVYETAAGSGIFKVGTDVSEMALAAGYYQVAAEITKTWIPVDESGTPQAAQTVTTETDKTQFQIVTTTLGKDLGDAQVTISDHDSRLPDAESTLVDGSNTILEDSNIWKLTDGTLTDVELGREIQNDGGDAKIYHDGGSDEWKAVTDGGGTVVIGSGGNPQGTNYVSFTINQDDTAEAYTTLIFKNGGTNIGAIRFHESTPKIEAAPDYQEGSPTWTNLAAAAANKIQDSFGGNIYELKVNSSDGSVTVTKDPSGSPVVLFKLDADGTFTLQDDADANIFKVAKTNKAVTTYGSIIPDVDDQDDFGAIAKRLADGFFSGAVNTLDLVISNDGGATEIGKFEGDVGNDIVIPHNVAIGFMDG